MDLNNNMKDDDRRRVRLRNISTCYNHYCTTSSESIEGRLGAPTAPAASIAVAQPVMFPQIEQPAQLAAAAEAADEDVSLLLLRFDSSKVDIRRGLGEKKEEEMKRKFRRRLEAVNSHNMMMMAQQNIIIKSSNHEEKQEVRRRRRRLTRSSSNLSAFKNLNNNLRIKLSHVLLVTALALFSSLYLPPSTSQHDNMKPNLLLFVESHEHQINQRQHKQWYGPEQGAWFPATAPEVVRGNERILAADEATSSRSSGGLWGSSRAGESPLSPVVGVNSQSSQQQQQSMMPTAAALDYFGSRLPETAAAAVANERMDTSQADSYADITSSQPFNGNQFSSRQGQLAPISGDQQANRRPLQRQQQQQQQQQQQVNGNNQGGRQRLRGGQQQLPANLASAQSSVIEHTIPSQQPGVNQQLDQQFRSAGVDLQPRFQRLRTPPGGAANEQFLANGAQQQQQQQQQPNQQLQKQLLQFAASQNGRLNAQQPNGQQFGAPTLSAFDLSSLANLANQAFNPQQQQQQQQPQPQRPQGNQAPASALTRRLPLQQQQPLQPQQLGQRNQQPQQPANQVPNAGAQQQQQASANNGFNGNPSGPQFNSNSQTELPFIRQVFRPSGGDESGQQQPGGSSSGSSSSASAGPDETRNSRPTPPPLFVPARQINKVTRVMESGFSPVPMPPFGSQPQPQQQPPQLSSSPTGSREVFFEPGSGSQQQQQQQPARASQQQRVRQPGGSLNQGPVASPVQQVLPTPVPVASTLAGQPLNGASRQVTSANEPPLQPVMQISQAARKPPARRPSQRPQLLSAAAVATAPSRLSSNQMIQQQAQATTVPSVPNDVIRLAANAIQTANEGLAALALDTMGGSSTSQAPIGSTLAINSINQQQSASEQPTPGTSAESSTRPTSGPSSAQPIATTMGQQQQQQQQQSVATTQQANQNQENQVAVTTTTTTAATPFSSTGDPTRRATTPQLPLRTSANFFTTLTSSATTSPSASSFSPALPINAAVAASGGRRRIPVRSQASTSQAPGGSRSQFLATASSALANTGPTTTTTQATVSSPSSSSLSVRRPEIEEFYETISGPNGLAGNGAATTIDGFGAPSGERQQQPALGLAPTTQPEQVDRNTMTMATTTKDPDFYGSRLSGGGTSSAPANSDPSSDEEATGSGGHQRQQVHEQPARQQQVNRIQQQQQPPQLQLAASNSVQQQPVMVPVTYMTTLTYLTTVLHGTHTLETWHESVVKSTELATLNAQLMDQIEHRVPLIQPTATVSLSSKTKGKGTTIINLKSAVSAYNQELVEALGVSQPASASAAAAGNDQQQQQVRPSATVSQASVILQTAGPSSSGSPQQPDIQQAETPTGAASRTNKFRAPARGNLQQQQQQAQKPLVRPSRTIDFSELQEAKKSLLTEFVYLYTMKPLDSGLSGNANSNQLETTSVRSEIISGATDGPELMSQLLMASSSSSSSSGDGSSPVMQFIDSRGMMRIGAGQEAQPAPINLGSTIGRDQATMTEVNMNVATYIKFEDITNALVELRPSRLASDPNDLAADPSLGSQRLPQASTRLPQLDASFNVHLTLGEAIDKLQSIQPQPSSSQQTPALDLSATRPKVDELLRSTAADNSNRLSSSVGVSGLPSLARSQLRSRVASSRFRGAPLQSQQQKSNFQFLTPSAAPSAAAGKSQDQLVQSSSVGQAAAGAAVAPSSSTVAIARSQQRPMKSRIVRPPGSAAKPAASQQGGDLAQPEVPAASSPAQQEQQPAAAASPAVVVVSRATKPRFVVVTRTGQFGIRASAMSSMASLASQSASAAAAAEQAAAIASSSSSTEAMVKPSSVGAEPSQLSTNRVSSRFSKPNRFRGSSQSIQRQPQLELVSSTLSALPVSSATLPAQSQSPPSAQQPASVGDGESQQSPSASTSFPTSLAAPEPAGSRETGPSQTGGANSAADTTVPAPSSNANANANDQQATGGDNSVIVTYFTTTTHTIPFTINSETIFTTIEETNSRVATEFMRDFVEPTPAATQPTATATAAIGQLQAGQNLPATSQQEATLSQQQPTTLPPVTTTTTTAAAAAAAQAQANSSQQQPPKPEVAAPTTSQPSNNLEPSFVLSVNTRTYFTTFTYFTTYSAGQATPTIKSSESTTSNILTETVTSLFEPSKTYPLDQLEPTATLKQLPSIDDAGNETPMSSSVRQSMVSAMPTLVNPSPFDSSSVQVSNGQEAASSSHLPTPPMETAGTDLLTTRTLLNTMTYYGTLYNGTQTSLTPIFDVSTEVLTFSSNGASAIDSSSSAISDSSATMQINPTSRIESSLEQVQTAASVATQMVPVESTNVAQQSSSQDKITRIRSLYTTLTHFITFYSGTKTQLSTIQEISPTVVTEYIDRTQFELQKQQQQQQQQPAAESGSQQQPEVTSSVMIQMTPTPVLNAEQILATTPPADSQSGSQQEPAQSGSSPSATVTTSTTSQATDDTSEGEWASSKQSGSSSSSNGPTTPAAGSSSPPPTTIITTTTTGSTATTNAEQTSGAELNSVRVSKPSGSQTADSQSLEGRQESPRVLASSEQSSSSSSSSGDGTSSPTNIIELSDLIGGAGSSNSSQSGRVALAGNLGAAIKDIVQLLAGNKTNTMSPALPGLGPQHPEAVTEQQAATTTTTSTSPASSTTTAASSSSQAAPANRLRGGAPTRLYGQKAKEQQLLNLQGSISSPSAGSTTTSTSTELSSQQQQAAGSSRLATPELASVSSRVQQQEQQQQQQAAAAATIFFGDDGGDERKKQIKTVWPAAAQSTLYVTSIEPSTRSLTLTTTKVYYTRDAPLTITSSFTTLIAPRTFVSTIMGTRTLVNQLNTQQVQPLANMQQQPVESKQPQVAQKPTAPSRQDSQAAGHRLSVQQKQQKQHLLQEQQQVKQQLQQQQQQATTSGLAASASSSNKLRSANRPQDQQQSLAGGGANINQCQPACRMANNEICRFQPVSETSGAQGTFSCACRPGYHSVVNGVGQRQCKEVQSYVVLLRLLQIGDQQVSFKKELQDKSSSEYKQFARLVKDHVKRAYMTSDLTRDRFVSADVINYARSLAIQPALNSISTGPQPTAGRQPVAFNSTQVDPLNAGVIVNITVQMQPPTSSNELLDEATLKEELTKKLNLRQAAALAAAAAAANRPKETTSGAELPSSPSTETGGGGDSGTGNGSSQPADEALPNPNALFLADVEQVTDLDECANPALNDCHESAACTNEVGSYKCDCREYPDLNPLHPGRQCASELKSCDYCNNRGDCLRVPSMHSSTSSISAAGGGTPYNSSSSTHSSSTGANGSGRLPGFSTVCQCHRFYLGRRCEINGLMLACLLPIVTILLFVSVCLVIYCCRRWRKRSAMSKGFRNIGTFGPNMIGGTLDRKAMLESSSESSDTHQRSHHLRAAANGIYDTTGGIPSDPPSSSNESSPRQMVRNQMVDGGLLQGSSGYHLSPHLVDTRQQQTSQQQQLNPSLGPYSSSIPPQIVIPRARHNQVNYAVHRGQVYMW